jgi:polysaccharide export outer membrane protein
MFRIVRTAVRALLGIAAGALAACSGPGQYVWFSELPADPTGALVVHPGDTVSVRVLGHEEMSVKEKVRPDGRIALPLIGELEAQGKPPASLRGEIEARLKDYIVSPSVMLSVDDVQALSVAVLGEVTRPGNYVVEPPGGLAQVLAASGGLNEFARRDRIFVVRRHPSPARIRFTYEAVSRNEGKAGSFQLHPGDVVVVE